MRSANDVKSQAAATDEIDSLPGAPKLLSKHYSGFLSISVSKSIHYYYVESERNPVSDSIVFWTNGGPGCSGLLGLFVELGPWRPQSDGSLVRNHHSWTSLASIVFLEQPAGVGFSTTTNPEELETNDYNAARDNVATIREFFKRHPERANNKMYLASESYGGHYVPQLTVALLADKELSKNFGGFLLGNPYTSYASGDIAMAHTVWGLQLVDYPLWYEFTRHSCNKLSLNAYTLPDVCARILGEIQTVTTKLNPYALNYPVCTVKSPFESDGRVISKHHYLWSNSGQAQCIRNLNSRLGEYRSAMGLAAAETETETETANASLKTAALGHGNEALSESTESSRRRETELLSQSTIDAMPVGSSSSSSPQHWVPLQEGGQGADPLHGIHTHSRETSTAGNSLTYDPCTQSNTISYLNNPIVQAALHIIPLATSEPVKWDVCSDPIFKAWSLWDVYADTTGLFSDIYMTVSKQRLRGERTEDFKMLVFSGDTDGICATVGTQHWIYSVTSPIANTSASSATAAESYFHDLSSRSSLWQPWMIDDGETHVDALTGATVGGQQGGFLTKFEGSFSFATVHTAGHEVPAYQPAAALTLFAGFLSGSVFTPSVDTTSGSRSTGYNAAVAISLVTLAIIGLVAVCCLMYQRERKLRRGSAGPPVSMIESAEEDEGREGPGTLTARVATHRQYTAVNSGKYIAMATEDAAM